MGNPQQVTDAATAPQMEASMTRDEAIEKLKVEQQSDDPEDARGRADTILCSLLMALGYQDVVDEWEKVTKWYA